MRLPRIINIQVGRKLADRSKYEIMTEVIRVFCSEAVTVEVIQVFQPPTSSATEALSGQNSDLLQDNELDLLPSQSILTGLNPSRESDKR